MRTRRVLAMATLNEKQAALFTDRNWGVIATIREDGSPHATPVWIDYDGENVLVNSAYGRTKVTNIERDPRATVTVLPAADQQGGYVMVSGTAKIVEEGALEHINMRAAIGSSRPMSGGASSGGGSARSVAGSPTSRRKPSKWKGWKPIRAFDPSVSAMKVCGTPLGPKANEPAGSDRRRSPTYTVNS